MKALNKLLGDITPLNLNSSNADSQHWKNRVKHQVVPTYPATITAPDVNPDNMPTPAEVLKNFLTSSASSSLETTTCCRLSSSPATSTTLTTGVSTS